MAQLFNECARIVSNACVGPRLHVISLESPMIAQGIQPGQFVHMKVPGRNENILRRPFSVYSCDGEAGVLEILYQEVGEITSYLPSVKQGTVELMGPLGNTWDDTAGCALLVGGGVGAAPLFMLAERFSQRGVTFDVVLGAQTESMLVARERYAQLEGCDPCCATDDGSFGRAGFCTSLVEERLAEGSLADGRPYEFLAVCGPEPLMKIVARLGAEANVRTQVSMEKRMACGIGACLSCVVDTVNGKKRSCVDGPVFEAQEVVW